MQGLTALAGMIVSSLHLCRALSSSGPRSDCAHHVVLPPHECRDSIRVHPGCVHPYNRVHLPHCHTGRDSAQVCEPHLFYPVLPEPVHSVALAGHLVCLYWDLNVHRGVEKPRDHKKSAAKGRQEGLRSARTDGRCYVRVASAAGLAIVSPGLKPNYHSIEAELPLTGWDGSICRLHVGIPEIE